MKPKLQLNHFTDILLLSVLLFLIQGCSSSAGLVFSNREWHISGHYGQIIDKDTTFRMSFGNTLIHDPLTIVSTYDSITKYPGMEKYLVDILHKTRLDSAEILLYTPHMKTMFVKPKGVMPPERPSSISVELSEEKPYTMWIHRDETENWKRKSSEMYTYTYYDKRKKQILIVDIYDYGDTPIAQIFIFQTSSKALEKMRIPYYYPFSYHYAFYHKHDINNLYRDIEFWAYDLNIHREIAFENYKIGQEQKNKGK